MPFSVRSFNGSDPDQVAADVTAFLATQPTTLVIRGLDFRVRDNQRIPGLEVACQLQYTTDGTDTSTPFSLTIYRAPTRPALDAIFNKQTTDAPAELFYAIGPDPVQKLGQSTRFYLPVIRHSNSNALDNILIGGGHGGASSGPIWYSKVTALNADPSDYDISSFEFIVVNTNFGGGTMNMPPNPSAGDIVTVKAQNLDTGGSLFVTTNSFIINVENPNPGEQGFYSDFQQLEQNGLSATWIYVPNQFGSGGAWHLIATPQTLVGGGGGGSPEYVDVNGIIFQAQFPTDSLSPDYEYNLSFIESGDDTGEYRVFVNSSFPTGNFNDAYEVYPVVSVGQTSSDSSPFTGYFATITKDPDNFDAFIVSVFDSNGDKTSDTVYISMYSSSEGMYSLY